MTLAIGDGAITKWGAKVKSPIKNLKKNILHF